MASMVLGIMEKSDQVLADQFLEIASQTRLGILLLISEKPSNLSSLSTKLDATTSEVHRNLNRLVDSGMIHKEIDGNYYLTTIGSLILKSLSTWKFVIANRLYFTNHSIDDLPISFVHRIGELENSKLVKGFVRVQELWQKIYQNSESYIYNILYEVPYSENIMDLISSKLSKDVRLNSIFTESPIMPSYREKLLKKSGFERLEKQGIIEKKLSKNVKTLVVLNDTESCVMFPKADGMLDVSEAFYGDDKNFHDWAYDYFKKCWESSSEFRIEKIKS